MQNNYLSLPFFDKKHVSLSESLHLWCEANIDDGHCDSADLHAQCRSIARKLGDAGWLDYVVTKEYGGKLSSIDLRSICLIREILASHSGLADFVFAMQGLGSATISLFGSEEQKQRYLPKVRTGEAIAAFALTEEKSGSDVAALELRAISNGSTYILNGCKTYISNAGLADFYIVFARTGDAPGAKGISAFVVDKNLPGLNDRNAIVVNAPHPLGILNLKDCVVDADALVGQLNQGFRHAMGVLDMFRSSVGAAALGLAKRGFREAGERALSRRVFGQKLSDNQVIRSKLADMAVAIDASELLIYRSAWVFDTTGSPDSKLASMAKLYATEAAQSVIDEAVQIFGGLGVTLGCPVELLYREVRSLRIYEGASEIQRLVIGKRVISEIEQHHCA